MRAALILATMSLTLVGLAHAEHSASACESDITPIGAGDTMFYLIQDHEDDETWLFEETNGHPWVQRGGVAWHAIGGPTWLVDYECWDRVIATGEDAWPYDYIVM